MDLQEPLSGGGALQGLWYEQGDAAALVDADSKVDGGGGAGALRVARRKKRRKGRKWKDPSGLFITRQEDKGQARKSRSLKRQGGRG